VCILLLAYQVIFLGEDAVDEGGVRKVIYTEVRSLLACLLNKDPSMNQRNSN
jgi:hypothetical protein